MREIQPGTRSQYSSWLRKRSRRMRQEHHQRKHQSSLQHQPLHLKTKLTKLPQQTERS